MNVPLARPFLAFVFATLTLPLAAQMGDTRDAAGSVQPPPPAKWIRPAPVLTPEEALKTFSLPPGFRIELVASEPLIHDPVALDFDPDGRLWVAQMESYMPDVDGTGENKRINRVVVLEDTNGDGRMDKSTVYMDGLGLVRSVKVLKNGVLIGDPPNLWFTRDTDGDGKADEKTAIATDFSAPERNPEEGANGLIWGLDNWLSASAWGRRMRQVNGAWTSQPVMMRGQWGYGMDDWGRFYTNSSEDYIRIDLISGHYPARSPNLALGSRYGISATGVHFRGDNDQSVWPNRPDPGTNRGYWEGRLRGDGSLRNFDAACGPAIYRGDNFPAEFQGNYFNAEPVGHIVRRAILKDEDGIVRSHRAYEESEFLRSTDERFRPCNVYTAPDGTLYVVDMYRGIVQHRQYMTTFLRRQIIERGLDKGIGYGRIWRIVHEGKKPGPAPALSDAKAAELVALLSHPNGWWRDTAQRLLVEGGDKSVASDLRRLARATSAGAEVRAKALWTMEGLGVLDAGTVSATLGDPAPKLRATALRLSEPFLAASQAEVTTRVLKRADDSAREVRLQFALSLGEAPPAVREPALDALLRREAETQFFVPAIISSLGGRELAFIDRLLASADWREPAKGFPEALQTLASTLARGGKSEQLDPLFELIAGNTGQKWQRLALLNGARASSLRSVEAPPPALEAAAKSSDVDIARGATEVLSRLTWPGKFGPGPAPLTAAEQRLFEKGATTYATICAACHQPDGRGLPGVAAPLADSPWVQGPDSFLARIVLKGKVGKTTATMPPLEMLGNDVLASALTYVRRSWGNSAPPVQPSTISDMRETIILRSQPYTEEELTKLKEAGEKR